MTRSETFTVRLTPDQKARLFQHAEETRRSAGDVLLDSFFRSPGPATPPAPGGGDSLKNASGDSPPFFSDNPHVPPAGAASGAKAPDGEVAPDDGGGRRPASGDDDVESLRLENALLRELHGTRLAVDAGLLVEALKPLSHVADDGRVVVEWGGALHALRDALPPDVLAPNGGPGSGHRTPPDLRGRPAPKSALTAAVDSQSFYEAHREQLADAERMGGGLDALANTPASALRK